MNNYSPAGWYPDDAHGVYRYWDGSQWSAYTAPLYSNTTAELVKSTKRRWGLGDVFIGILLFFVLSFVAVAAMSVVVFTVGVIKGNELGEELFSQDWAFSLVLLAGGMASALSFVGFPLYVAKRKGSGSLKEDFGVAFKLVDVPIGIVSAFVCMIAGAAVSIAGENIFGERVTNTDTLTTAMGEKNLLLLLVTFFVVAIVVPFAEEVFFRGLTLKAFEKKYSVFPAVIFSSVLFGLLHMQDFSNWGAVILIPVVTGMYGLCFAVVTVLTKRIGAAVVAHTIVNGAAVLFTFFVVQ